MIDGHFEQEFFRLADCVFARGGVFFDVGANYGLMSLGLASRHADSVEFHLFEPNPKLIAAFARNSCLYPDMRAHMNTFAVSDY